jgi:hypothetical protein
MAGRVQCGGSGVIVLTAFGVTAGSVLHNFEG